MRLNKGEREKVSVLLYVTCIDTAWTWIVSGWDNSCGSATRKVNSPVLQEEKKRKEKTRKEKRQDKYFKKQIIKKISLELKRLKFVLSLFTSLTLNEHDLET